MVYNQSLTIGWKKTTIVEGLQQIKIPKHENLTCCIKQWGVFIISNIFTEVFHHKTFMKLFSIQQNNEKVSIIKSFLELVPLGFIIKCNLKHFLKKHFSSITKYFVMRIPYLNPLRFASPAPAFISNWFSHKGRFHHYGQQVSGC